MRNLCRLCFILLGLFASVLIILIYCFIIILLLCSLSLARGRRRWRHPSPPPLKTHVLDGTFPIKFCCPRAFLGGVCSTWRVFLHNKVFDKNVLKKGWVWTTTGTQAGAGAQEQLGRERGVILRGPGPSIAQALPQWHRVIGGEIRRFS